MKIVDEKDIEKDDPELKLKIFNETRVTVISLFKRLQKYMKVNNPDADKDPDEINDDVNDEDDLDYDPDYFHVALDENMNEDYLY